jgi:hypothetical protein
MWGTTRRPCGSASLAWRRTEPLGWAGTRKRKSEQLAPATSFSVRWIPPHISAEGDVARRAGAQVGRAVGSEVVSDGAALHVQGAPVDLRNVTELIAGPGEREAEERVDAEPQAWTGSRAISRVAARVALSPWAVEAPADVAGQLDRVRAFDSVRFECLQGTTGSRRRARGSGGCRASVPSADRAPVAQALEAPIHDSADLRARKPCGGGVAA